MTDEEKAEEIINNFLRQRKFYFSDLDMAKDLIKIALVEGKKVGFDEGYKKATERAYERQEDLTETFIRDGEIIKKLGEDIAELKDQKEDLCESLDIMNDRESELLEQIEKMKNVGNCKHSMICAKWNEKQTVLGLMKFCLYCKDWELAG